MGERGKIPAGSLIIVNLSGRGDKDMMTVAKALNVKL
jgi:tryptophan synthase beta chain